MRSVGLPTQNPCRVHYNLPMSNAPPLLQAPVLKGWRARVWAWVLFVALLKGLIPHAALASALMSGDPALVWCALGAQSSAGEAKATGGMSAAAHSCVCASSGDAAMPLVRSSDATAPRTHAPALRQPDLVVVTQRLLPPPARGPPAL